MNKLYYILLNKFKEIKNSISDLSSTFFQRKKTIDKMYLTMIQHKTSEIKILENALKTIHNKNSKIEKDNITFKTLLNKKNNLISTLQDLLTQRID